MSLGEEDYAVPKHSVTARLRLVGREPSDVLLHLSEGAAHHRGRELPSDLLNEDGAFLPVQDPAGGEIRLVHRRCLLWVSVSADDERRPGGGESATEADDPGVTSERVRVLFDDGSELVGSLRWVLPAGQRRVRDYLEQADTFFPLHVGDRVKLVNRDRVASVELQ